jgi:hypothetical protein
MRPGKVERLALLWVGSFAEYRWDEEKRDRR